MSSLFKTWATTGGLGWCACWILTHTLWLRLRWRFGLDNHRGWVSVKHIFSSFKTSLVGWDPLTEAWEWGLICGSIWSSYGVWVSNMGWDWVFFALAWGWFLFWAWTVQVFFDGYIKAKWPRRFKFC